MQACLFFLQVILTRFSTSLWLLCRLGYCAEITFFVRAGTRVACLYHVRHVHVTCYLVAEPFSSRAGILTGGAHHTRRSQSTCALPKFYVKYLQYRTVPNYMQRCF